MNDLLIWPNSDVVMMTGVQTAIYGALSGSSIGTGIQVRILHLDSGQYWRPDDTFGEAIDHTGFVVSADGHWRLMVEPQAAGAYRVEVSAIDSDGTPVVASSEFSVIGEDLKNPYIDVTAESIDSSGNDLSMTSASSEEPPSLGLASADGSSKTFWEGRQGIGFSIDSQGQWPSDQRLEAALLEVSNLGFDTIRTWGTNSYTGKILETIDQLGLDLKVQAGVYITSNNDPLQLINEAVDILQPYEQYVLGVSLGNEQLADWNPNALEVSDVLQHVEMFRALSDLSITYNFSGETLRSDSSFWNQQGADLLQSLDYVNVHSYAGFFDNRFNPEWTPELQMNVLKQDEALFRSILDGFDLADTPLILGETGWQSGGYSESVTNIDNMESYFQKVNQYIASEEAQFDSLFYFNFSDESWKGGDDFWGIYNEGDESEVGVAKFDASSSFYSTQNLDIEPTKDLPGLRLISDSGRALLLIDDATGQAYVQIGDEEPLAIRRDDNYWQGGVPLQRGEAELVGAAVDDLGRIRVLDRGPWGDFNWIVDENGLFIGEEGPGVISNASNELLFQIDLDDNQMIGAVDVVAPFEDEAVTNEEINPFDLTGFSQGEFVSNIGFSHRDTTDPIVSPGNANFMHAHDFFANTSTDENSTVSSLLAAGTSAAQPTNNLSTYWAPSLINEGRDGLGGEWSYVTPLSTSIAYYSVVQPNDPNRLVNMPVGMKMIAGSARPSERQSRAQVFWNYIGESASYDHIPLGDQWRDLPLQAVVIFPDHWNGEQLDSSDHKSHLNYGAGSNEHPLLLPQLQLQLHYGKIDNNLHLVSSDYMNLPEAGSELYERLLDASYEDLSFRNNEEGFAPGWSLHADHIHLPWEEVAPNGELVDGFFRREEDALRLPLFAGTDGDAVRPIPTGITQPYSTELAMLPKLGTPGDDLLIGTFDADRLESMEGDDTLVGGLGGDLLIGADGADRFVLESIEDSTLANPDRIVGFSVDDRLDLSSLGLEANSIQINQLNSSTWKVGSFGTDLAVEIQTGSISLDQVLLS